jgi:hypothetical protein
MRALQEEMAMIQVPQMEMRMRVVMMTQVHQVMTTTIQMMIQSQPPPQTHLDSAEGPFPALLWGVMQGIGFLLKPRYEAHLFKNAQQEEEWLVAVVIYVPDERPSCRVEYSKHIDEVPRRTLAARTSEAARRALYYLCHA